MVSLKGMLAACAATMLLAGCANSELNREVSQTFPIHQMDAFFGYRSPPPAPTYSPSDAASPGYAPAYAPDSGYAPAYPPYGKGYAPAYPPYDPAGQKHL